MGDGIQDGADDIKKIKDLSNNGDKEKYTLIATDKVLNQSMVLSDLSYMSMRDAQVKKFEHLRDDEKNKGRS